MDRRILLLICCLLLTSVQLIGQFQMGNSISENLNYRYDNRSLDISSNGTVIALINNRDLNASDVKVFEYTDKEWKQKGASISNLRIGPTRVLVSGDGNTVFVNEIVTVGVYRWNGTEWNKANGPVEEEMSGLIGDISISKSGNRVALYYEDYDHYFPYVSMGIFEWNGSEWDTIGSIIRSYDLFDFAYGLDFELSGDGSTLIEGYEGDDFFNVGGEVTVYRFDGMDWALLGDTIQDSIHNSIGEDVSLSHDGNRLITSGRDHIKAWSWDGQQWHSLGLPIDGDDGFNAFINLDSSGNYLATGRRSYTDDKGIYQGKISLYEFDGQRWRLYGLPVIGEQAKDQFGAHMALSDNGKVMVAASERFSGREGDYVKSYLISTAKYWPTTFISGLDSVCDYQRLANFTQYDIELNDGRTAQIMVDSNKPFNLPVWDSTFIRPSTLKHFYSVPKETIIDSLAIMMPHNQPYVLDTFCLIPNDISTIDVKMDMFFPYSAVAGFNVSVLIKYTNRGSIPVSGEIDLYFEEQYQKYLGSYPDETELSSDRVRWEYTDLMPLESKVISASFRLNRPTDSIPLSGGELLQYNGRINPFISDVDTSNNKVDATVEVVNSYDPNDKRCMQGDTISPESVGSALTYVIRFENVGTAEAIDVRIRDVIDTTMLDISTFEMIDASHDGYMVQISDGNIIDFIFKGINLPFDDANNDGYVAFNMHTKKHLQLGDVVKNDAAIYFDFNHPVITNEMITLVADQPTSIPTHNPQLGLSVYPNPASNMARINAKTGILRVDLIDIQGRQLRQEVFINGADNTREIPVTGLSQGNYWLRVTTDEGIGTIPLMVK